MIINAANNSYSIKDIKRIFLDEVIKFSCLYNTHIQFSYEVTGYNKITNNAIEWEISFIISGVKFDTLQDLEKALKNKAFI